MCDYSLAEFRSRLAVEGEDLVAHRFPTHSIGLASPSELCPKATENRPHSLWSRIDEFLKNVTASPSVTAVCVPPGACLILSSIPMDRQLEWGVEAVECVRFVQTSAESGRHRDAVEFGNGRRVLLQSLAEGMTVRVVHLGRDHAEEAEPVFETLGRQV